MPTYINRTIEDINLTYRCSFCSGRYKSKSGVKNHMKRCNDNDEQGEDLSNIMVYDNASAEDMIIYQEAVLKLTTELIQNNELNNIQTLSPEEIRAHIRQRMQNVMITELGSTYYEECDVYLMYEFFFGLTEEDKNKRAEEAAKRMMNKMFI